MDKPHHRRDKTGLENHQIILSLLDQLRDRQNIRLDHKLQAPHLQNPHYHPRDRHVPSQVAVDNYEKALVNYHISDLQEYDMTNPCVWLSGFGTRVDALARMSPNPLSNRLFVALSQSYYFAPNQIRDRS